MKRKNLLAIVMVAVMVMLLAGCGNNKVEDVTIDNTNPVESSEAEQETETVENSVEVKQEKVSASSEPVDINSLITEKTDEELDLKQYTFSYEDRTMDKEGEQVFDLDWFMEDVASTAELFVTTNKVNLYNINGIRVGYALEDTMIDSFCEYEGWCFFYLDGHERFARAEDIRANSKTWEQIEAEAKAEEEAVQQSSVKTETPVQNTQSEQPVVNPIDPDTVESTASDKYTPEEAMAVYRSLMEAGGITWNPALKDVVSWGTGIMYLDKGYPEWAADSSLQSFAIGNHGGDSWTEFYFEINSFDEETVYYTQWRK